MVKFNSKWLVMATTCWRIKYWYGVSSQWIVNWSNKLKSIHIVKHNASTEFTSNMTYTNIPPHHKIWHCFLCGLSTSVSYTAEGVMFLCIIQTLLVKQNEFAALASISRTYFSTSPRKCVALIALLIMTGVLLCLLSYIILIAQSNLHVPLQLLVFACYTVARLLKQQIP